MSINGLGYHEKYKIYYIYSSGYFSYGRSFQKLDTRYFLTYKLPSTKVGTAGAKSIINYDLGFIAANISYIILLNPDMALSDKEIYTNTKRFVSGVKDIIKFKDSYYIGADGLYKYSLSKDAVEKVISKSSIISAPIRSFTKFNDNYFVVGTDGFGIYFFDGNNRVIPIEQSFGSSINKVIYTNNYIWAATANGVHQYEVYDDVTQCKLIHIYFKDDGLLEDNINSIELIGDKLFVAQDKGLSILNINANNYKEKLNPTLIMTDITTERPIHIKYEQTKILI